MLCLRDVNSFLPRAFFLLENLSKVFQDDSKAEIGAFSWIGIVLLVCLLI